MNLIYSYIAISKEIANVKVNIKNSNICWYSIMNIQKICEIEGYSQLDSCKKCKNNLINKIPLESLLKNILCHKEEMFVSGYVRLFKYCDNCKNKKEYCTKCNYKEASIKKIKEIIKRLEK